MTEKAKELGDFLSFPHIGRDDSGLYNAPGLTKREYFVIMILNGLVQRDNYGRCSSANCKRTSAERAIMLVDELLEELSNTE